MKTLKNHTLLFDEECPICTAYSAGMVKTGILEKEGRVSYQQSCTVPKYKANMDRAKNEIALINNATGEVYYGIESLCVLLSVLLPPLSPLFKWKFFQKSLKPLYFLISYNRKVILTTYKTTDTCIPELNKTYRTIYILLTCLFTSYTLSNYTKLLFPIVPISNSYRELLICMGQIVFQICFLYLLKSNRKWDYIGHMMSVSLLGSICLGGILLFRSIFSLNLSPFLYTLLFLGLVIYLFYLHFKRVHFLKQSYLLSFTWLIYRFIVLLLIY